VRPETPKKNNKFLDELCQEVGKNKNS